MVYAGNNISLHASATCFPRAGATPSSTVAAAGLHSTMSYRGPWSGTRTSPWACGAWRSRARIVAVTWATCLRARWAWDGWRGRVRRTACGVGFVERMTAAVCFWPSVWSASLLLSLSDRNLVSVTQNMHRGSRRRPIRGTASTLCQSSSGQDESTSANLQCFTHDPWPPASSLNL